MESLRTKELLAVLTQLLTELPGGADAMEKERERLMRRMRKEGT